MPRYLIYSAEQIFGGLHGMCVYEVIECADEKAALDYALEGSYDVMDTYYDIIENLEEQARDSISFDEEVEEDTLEYENLFFSYLDQLRDENTEYMAWKINEEKAKDYSLKELNDILFNEGASYFLDKFCIEI